MLRTQHPCYSCFWEFELTLDLVWPPGLNAHEQLEYWGVRQSSGAGSSERNWVHGLLRPLHNVNQGRQQGGLLQNHALDRSSNTSIDIWYVSAKHSKCVSNFAASKFWYFLVSFTHYSLSSPCVYNYPMTFSWSNSQVYRVGKRCYRTNVVSPFICFLHLQRIAGYHEIVKSTREERSPWLFKHLCVSCGWD